MASSDNAGQEIGRRSREQAGEEEERRVKEGREEERRVKEGIKDKSEEEGRKKEK